MQSSDPPIPTVQLQQEETAEKDTQDAGGGKKNICSRERERENNVCCTDRTSSIQFLGAFHFHHDCPQNVKQQNNFMRSNEERPMISTNTSSHSAAGNQHWSHSHIANEYEEEDRSIEAYLVVTSTKFSTPAPPKILTYRRATNVVRTAPRSPSSTLFVRSVGRCGPIVFTNEQNNRQLTIARLAPATSMRTADNR